jgi:predicted metal-dependent phosphoesterase TrpH
MKIELHSHTRRYSGCSQLTPLELVNKLADQGYGAVYITEHDRFWNDWELAQLRDECPRIRIFPGIELSLLGGPQHLLVLGTNDEEYLSMRMEPAAVLAKARAQNHLTVLAHPCRWDGGDAILQEGLLPDAIEHLSWNQQEPQQAERATETAQRLGLPMVNAGDVHAEKMIGQFWIESAGPVEKADDIRGIVLMGGYRLCQHPRD